MKVLPFIPIILFLVSTGIMAQQEDSLLTYNMDEEIVVTANRVETPIHEIGNSITVINKEQIENSGKLSVIELLDEIPGVSITQQGGPGKLASIFLRGANANHTLVLVDGVEMNMPADPGNSFDFSNLLLADIERIEVLRGPQSTLYGSDALAGVIQIFTHEASETNQLHLNLKGGSYATYSGNLGISGKVNRLSYYGNYSRHTTEGFSSAAEKYGNTEDDGFQCNVFSGKIGFQFSDNVSMALFGKYTNSEVELDQSAGQGGDDPNFTSDLEETVLKMQFNVGLFNGHWKQSFSLSYLRNYRKYNDQTDEAHPLTASNSFYDGNKLKFEWQNTIKFGDKNLIMAGIETEEEKAESEYHSEGIWGPYDSFFPSKRIRTTGIYAQDQFRAFDNFFLNFGGRYDNHDLFGWVFNYRITPVYIISPTKTKFKATYGTGFKAPSLFYLYDPTYGNSELDPEENTGWDAGFEQYLFNDRLTFGITYFGNSFKNLFGYDPMTFQTINIAKVETKGIEFILNTNPVKNLRLSFNYTFTDTKDKTENTEDSNKKLLRRPEKKLAVVINYSPINKLNLNLEGIYTGERDDKDFSVYPPNRIKLGSYTLINLSMKYKLYNFVNVNLSFKNLLDTDYEEIFGYGTPGRAIYGGCKFSFKW